MNMNLKMFCILCLCIIVCDTSKASENLTFVFSFCQVFLLSSLSVGAMKIKDSGEQITLDLFQNCDVPEEISITFDPEVDLNDDAVGRSWGK